MSRYYIYDSVTDSVAEFKQYSSNSRRSVASGQNEPAPRTVQSSRGQIVPSPRGELAGGTYSVPQTPRGRIGHRSQQTLAQNLLGTSVAGRAVRGAGVAAALGAAALGANALRKRGKKKAEEARQKSSIKGRIKSLLGR